MDQPSRPKMTPTAYLIGRENVNNCSHQLLTTIVDRVLATQTQRTFELYSVQLSRKNDLTVTRITKSPFHTNKNLLPTDEGFESDIDNASLLSSDGDSINFVDPNKPKHPGSDSANSSSASDSSDTESTIKQQAEEQTQIIQKQTFQLDQIVCYTNLRFPKIIGLVNNRKSTTNEFLIFEFVNLEGYDRIRYAFNSLSSQAINRNVQSQQQSSSVNTKKFNLVQRTDKNGVTHIEISRGGSIFHENTLVNSSNQQPSSIISINTPETNDFDYKVSNLSRGRSNSQADVTKLVSTPTVIQIDSVRSYDDKVRGKKEIDCVIRSDVDLVDHAPIMVEGKKYLKTEPMLKKVWRSAEDILDDQSTMTLKTTESQQSLSTIQQPKKPERHRRKQKGRAPPPPNIMKGQYIRVNVDPNKPIIPNSNLKLTSFESNKLDNYNSNWVYVASTQNSPTDNNIRFNTSTSNPFTKSHSTSEFRTDIVDQQQSYTLNRRNREMLSKNSERLYQQNQQNKWTNSVPRLPKKILPQQMMMIRSRSESNRYHKNNPYKYVDTTKSVPLIFNSSQSNNYSSHQSIHSSLPTVINNNLFNSNSNNNNNSISNRLFGLSQKLKEFGTNVVNTNHKFLNNQEYNNQGYKYRRNSIGELNYKMQGSNGGMQAPNNVGNLTSRYGTATQPTQDYSGNLKSVIKKSVNDSASGHCSSNSDHESNNSRKSKNNNEKKVTFSAFATVQVV